MKKLSIVLAAAAVMIAAPAVAADLRMPRKAAPAAMVAPIANWNGFYIGVHGGFGWADAEYNFAAPGFWNPAAGDIVTHRMDGFLLGGHAGYNWQMGNFVLGLEGSATWGDVRGRATSPFAGAFATDVFDTRVEWMSTITPRVGVVAGPALLYAKGGVAFAELRTSISNAAGTVFDRTSDTATGWTAGVGGEFMFAPGWILGVEANYYDFGDCCRVTNTTTGGIGTNHDTRVDMVSVLGRVSYKFGWDAPVRASY